MKAATSELTRDASTLDEAMLDRVFHALANTTRRRILDAVAAAPGCCIAEVASRFEMSRIGVLKHINLLEDAGLLVSQRVGRERPLYVNPAPLQLIQERWTDRYAQFWATRLGNRRPKASRRRNAFNSASFAKAAAGAL